MVKPPKQRGVTMLLALLIGWMPNADTQFIRSTIEEKQESITIDQLSNQSWRQYVMERKSTDFCVDVTGISTLIIATADLGSEIPSMSITWNTAIPTAELQSSFFYGYSVVKADVRMYTDLICGTISSRTDTASPLHMLWQIGT